MQVQGPPLLPFQAYIVHSRIPDLVMLQTRVSIHMQTDPT